MIEAFELFKRFKWLEYANGCLVEAEFFPWAVTAEILKRTGLTTNFLGSGPVGDVDYSFMEEIRGDSKNPPRHAGNLETETPCRRKSDW